MLIGEENAELGHLMIPYRRILIPGHVNVNLFRITCCIS